MHPNHKILFEPVKIGPVTSKNRFYQVPHGVGAGNQPDIDAGIKGVRAEGGWGVVCCEITSIHPSSDQSQFGGIRRMWNDQHVKDNAVTADAIHEHDALAGIELGHYGMMAFNYSSRDSIIGPSRQFSIGDAVSSPLHAQMQARAMTKHDIRTLLGWQRDAAVRARDAGFDIIYVYAAHRASLPLQFLASRNNFRTDEYGGSLENRARLLREMIEVTKDAVGDKCAVAVRLSVDELLGPDGITVQEEGRGVIELLGELPDLWDINLSDWDNDSQSSRFSNEGYQEDYVKAVKPATTKPVVGVGRFTSPDTMASQVRRGVLDLIGAARASIADPFLPEKIRAGRSDDIRECIGCNQCIYTANHLVVSRCTQNPTMGEEWRRGWHPEIITKQASKAHILVVGAGPAGLEATSALAQRGYEVTLAEAGDTLGGRVRLESTLPGMAEWIRVADWRTNQIQQLPNVDIFKGNKLTAQEIIEMDFAHVAIATGSSWLRNGSGPSNRAPLSIDSTMPIYTVDDLLSGVIPQTGPVVVFDDDHGYMGGVIAEMLRTCNLEVRLITPGHHPSQGTVYTLEAEKILERLHERNVAINVQSNVCEICGDSVIVENLISRETEEYPTNAVVLVTGRKPRDDLYMDLISLQTAPSTKQLISLDRIGDCDLPDSIAAAVFSGHRYAREFDCEPGDSRELPLSRRSLRA